MKNERLEARYWANQHGHGITVWGETLELLEAAAEVLGVTVEEFVNKAIAEHVKKHRPNVPRSE